MSGTPSLIATIAAPGCARPGTGSFCRVPSMKIPTMCPAEAAQRATRIESRSPSPRLTANAPVQRRSSPAIGIDSSSIFAM
jgi:hypothetical protein